MRESQPLVKVVQHLRRNRTRRRSRRFEPGNKEGRLQRPSVRRGLVTLRSQLLSSPQEYSQPIETPNFSLDMGSPPLGCWTSRKRRLFAAQNASARLRKISYAFVRSRELVRRRGGAREDDPRAGGRTSSQTIERNHCGSRASNRTDARSDERRERENKRALGAWRRASRVRLLRQRVA